MHHSLRRQAAFAVLAALILAASSISMAGENAEDAAAAHMLQAEIALNGDDYLQAATEYRRAAERSENAEIARQATRMAFDYGFNDEALRAAKRWFKLDRDSDDALLHLGQAQLRQGDMRDARKSFKKLIERGQQPAEQRIYSLVAFLSDEDPKKADELMRALTRSYGDSALAQYSTAAVALQADDAEFAMERTQRAMELDPEWLKAKLLYGRILLLTGETDKAIDYTARIIGDDPDPDPDARMELALMYLTAGRDDDALSQVNQVLLERASRTDALRMMAIINFRQNNLDAAWDDFEDLLASGDYTADALFYLARIADFREQYDTAIRLYSEVKAGNNAVASQRRASALLAYENDDPDAALRQLDEFADSRPRYAVDMVLAEAQLLASLDRHAEALEKYDRAITYRPDSESVALGRAELMLRMGRLEDSVAAYRRAAKRWPDSSVTLNALGYTLADRTEEYAEAEKLIRKALKYDPDSPAIIDSLGWVLYKLGNHEEALVHLQVAYEKFPDHEVAAHLVEVLAVLEREEEALELLAAAEIEDPESDLLKDVRERLFPQTP